MFLGSFNLSRRRAAKRASVPSPSGAACTQSLLQAIPLVACKLPHSRWRFGERPPKSRKRPTSNSAISVRRAPASLPHHMPARIGRGLCEFSRSRSPQTRSRIPRLGRGLARHDLDQARGKSSLAPAAHPPKQERNLRARVRPLDPERAPWPRSGDTAPRPVSSEDEIFSEVDRARRKARACTCSARELVCQTRARPTPGSFPQVHRGEVCKPHTAIQLRLLVRRRESPSFSSGAAAA